MNTTTLGKANEDGIRFVYYFYTNYNGETMKTRIEILAAASTAGYLICFIGGVSCLVDEGKIVYVDGGAE